MKSLTMAEVIKTKEPIEWLNITALDASVDDFVQCDFSELKYLNISRLNLSDEFVSKLFSSVSFKNLRWLDLCGNRYVSINGIRAICESIKKGLIDDLKFDYLSLIGTGYDATPYIDGHYWRMSSLAKELVSEFGYQRWMMLGSRKPEDEHNQILTKKEISESYITMCCELSLQPGSFVGLDLVDFAHKIGK